MRCIADEIYFILLNYGPRCLHDIKSYMNLNCKLANVKNRIFYLLEMKKLNITPPHICNNLTYKNSDMFSSVGFHDLNSLLFHFKRKIFILEIDDSHRVLSKTKVALSRVTNNLKFSLPGDVLNYFFQSQQKAFTIILQTKRRGLVDKINNLLTYTNTSIGDFAHDYVINLSNITIPNSVNIVLSLGHSHNFIDLSKSKKQLYKLITDTEFVISDAPTDKADEIRAKAVNVITNYNNSKKLLNGNFNSKLIEKYLRETKTFYKNNKDKIIVVKSDKSNHTVIMGRDDYNNKVELLLKDEKTYSVLKTNPTNRLQNIINSQIKNIIASDDLGSEKMRLRNCIIHNGIAPKLYCLIKTHKNNALRPIVTTIGSPLYKISKYIVEILNQIPLDSINIKDSFSFKEKLNYIGLGSRDILVSFDAVSLFTNINLDKAYDIILDKWPLIEGITVLNKEQFFELLRLIFDNAYFVYGDKVFEQKRGVAMGSSLGPIIANLYMDHLLTNYTNLFPYSVPFLYKFVDDIITAMPRDQVVPTLNIMNSLDDDIKFTEEIETNGMLDFLDLRLVRANDKIYSKWNRREVKSERLLNYYSNHPLVHKQNLIFNLITRADRLSDKQYKNEAIVKVKQLLSKNNYPGHFTEKILRLYNHRLKFPREPPDSVPDGHSGDFILPIYRSLTYISGLSERLKNLIVSYIPNVKVSFKPINTLAYMYNNKTPTPFLKNSNLIYKINCQGCNLSYVGMTGQYLHKRIYQHKYNISKKEDHIALSAHTLETGHIFNFDATEILAFESNKFKREVLENIFIFTNQTVNFKQDFNSTIRLYRNVL